VEPVTRKFVAVTGPDMVERISAGAGWHTKAQFEAAFATFGDMAVVVGS
jgi:hypothetical protein